ncbi:MAG TPA: hypothetical protein VFP66_15735 [Candidatus Limnocylindrales bacterium]|nr:hypothetical protein [Candidatus Limnocylindrales bacterium]
MIRPRVAWLFLCLSLAACTGTPPSQTAEPSASPSAAETAIVLHEAPANLGCDTIGIDYTSMTFRIDPTAAEQVSAVTDTGVTLTTYWSVGFQPGSDAERVIRDPAGKVVVSHDEVLLVPPAAYPRLAGYFVCLAPDKLYVLLADPS